MDARWVVAAVGLFAAAQALAADRKPDAGTQAPDELAAWLGTWEGESLCTVPSSPCHDEHVVYEITQKPVLTIDGYKIVRGEKLFMGSIECATPKDKTLTCTIPNSNRVNSWEFVRNGPDARGQLFMDAERTLFRRIHVTKKSGAAQ